MYELEDLRLIEWIAGHLLAVSNLLLCHFTEPGITSTKSSKPVNAQVIIQCAAPSEHAVRPLGPLNAGERYRVCYLNYKQVPTVVFFPNHLSEIIRNFIQIQHLQFVFATELDTVLCNLHYLPPNTGEALPRL